MNLIRGPPENIKPVNVSLMLFSEDPSKFFTKTYAEMSVIDDPSGNIIDDTIIKGPIDVQIRSILRYLNNNVILKRTIKIPDQAESIKIQNYPYDVLEEIVTNAYYHRGYDIEEPIKIRIYKEKIVIINYPGPDISIRSEDIANGKLICENYRNSRLGDYLKELDLAESRNSGIPRVLRSMKNNGSGRPIFETDEQRRFMRVTIPIHPEFLKNTIKTIEYKPTINTRRDPIDIKNNILEYLRSNGCSSASNISSALGYSSITNTFRRCLKELMNEGLVDYLYPDNPRDTRQKICLKRRSI